ncbi:MAG: Ig-like domain-containing protein [bacterium]|nr:MAG: Ig-like domain-containing protein [bacterium]
MTNLIISVGRRDHRPGHLREEGLTVALRREDSPGDRTGHGIMNPVITVLISVLALLFSSFLPAQAAVVGSFDLSLPAGTGLVMGDSTATLPFTLENDSSSADSIRWVRLYFDAALYYVSVANTPPAGWSVTEIKNAGAGQTYITYGATTGALDPGDSVDFSILVTGSNDGPFPADVSDITDSLESFDIRTGPRNNDDTFNGSSPIWTRHGLAASIVAFPASSEAGDLITVSVAVTNRTTVLQAGVTPGVLTTPGSGTVSYVGGPSPASVTLDSGQEQVFLYTYQAGSAGVVLFSGSASGSTSPLSSPTFQSNSVAIGDFTAQMALDPAFAISGQQVTVSITLNNNGTTPLIGITPTIVASPSSTAGIAAVSGPIPPAIGSLAPGQSAVVQRAFTVTGAAGDTFLFTGQAFSTTLSTDPVDTSVGEIFSYSATVAPDTFLSGSANVTLAFTAYNGGVDPARKVGVTIPGGWVFQSGAGPTGWTISSSGNPTVVAFQNTVSPIPGGGSETFTLTFSTIPAVLSPTPYNFLVSFWDTNTNMNQEPTGAVETAVEVLPYQVVLTASVPVGFSSPPIADGVEYYDLVATVTDGGSPLAGVPVLFSATVGYLGGASAVTDSLGRAVNTLTGPLSTVALSAAVTAEYLSAVGVTVLPFDPYTGLALDYVPGSLSPMSVNTGDPSVAFSLRVINVGTTDATLTTASSFSFTDSPTAVPHTFAVPLASSGPATVPPGGTAVLTFDPGGVDPAFQPGSYFPLLFLSDGASSGYRPVTDPVAVAAFPDLLVMKQVTLISDPVSAVNPKAIPGSVVQYTITVVNTGSGTADGDSVVIDDSVPNGAELFVGDLPGGSGPVMFSPMTSGLTYTFQGLGSPGDGVAFSADGGSSFNYIPVPDTDGFDSDVTDIRINPDGVLNGKTGPTNPGFSLSFRVRIR